MTAPALLFEITCEVWERPLGECSLESVEVLEATLEGPSIKLRTARV
jgi:hypothetical protein